MFSWTGFAKTKKKKRTRKSCRIRIKNTNVWKKKFLRIIIVVDSKSYVTARARDRSGGQKKKSFFVLLRFYRVARARTGKHQRRRPKDGSTRFARSQISLARRRRRSILPPPRGAVVDDAPR